MGKHSASIALFLLCVLAWTIPASVQRTAQAAGPQTKTEKTGGIKVRPTSVLEGELDETERINKWSVGLASGLIDGTFLKFAADIGTVLDDDDNLRVLTVLTKGSVQNVQYLLHLKGIDVALVSADTFEQFKKEAKIKNIENRIQYISQVHVSAIQFLARPDIRTLKDLEGKTIATPPKGSSATALTLKILTRNNIKVEVVEAGVSAGIEKLKTGEFAAVAGGFAKGAPSAYSGLDPKLGLHLLQIDFEKFANEYYVPVTFEHEDYPNLIAQNEKIETLGTPVVLAVYNWPKGTDRFRRVERFVQYYFDRIDRLKKPPYQPQWKEVNLAAPVPGWKRYWVAEEMLKKVSAAQRITAPKETVGTGATSAVPGSRGLGSAEEEKLMNEFREWVSQRKQQ